MTVDWQLLPCHRTLSAATLLKNTAGSLALCFLLFMLLVAAPGAQAQERAEQQPVETRIEIDDVRVLTRETPDYPDELGQASGSERDWTLIHTEFETAVSRGEYTDELEFVWTVGLLPRGRRPIILKRSVRYIDIKAEDNHFVALYIRPRFLERYYGDDRLRRNSLKVYLEVKNRDTVIARHHYPESNPKPIRQNLYWWQLSEPQIRRHDAELLTRLETPFAPMEFNFYEYIKPERYN